jgi:hypothetical protein
VEPPAQERGPPGQTAASKDRGHCHRENGARGLALRLRRSRSTPSRGLHAPRGVNWDLGAAALGVRLAIAAALDRTWASSVRSRSSTRRTRSAPAWRPRRDRATSRATRDRPRVLHGPARQRDARRSTSFSSPVAPSGAPRPSNHDRRPAALQLPAVPPRPSTQSWVPRPGVVPVKACKPLSPPGRPGGAAPPASGPLLDLAAEHVAAIAVDEHHAAKAVLVQAHGDPAALPSASRGRSINVPGKAIGCCVMPTQIVGATRTPASAPTRREMGLGADRIRAEDTVRTVLLRAFNGQDHGPLTRERLFDLAPSAEARVGAAWMPPAPQRTTPAGRRALSSSAAGC